MPAASHVPRRVATALVAILLGLTSLLARYSPENRPACHVPYTAAESALTCVGKYAKATRIGPVASSKETWAIEVVSKDTDAIAGSLVALWRLRMRVSHQVTIFARGPEGGGVGYDRGVLLARDQTLQFGVCVSWESFGNLGEVCGDEVRFSLTVPASPRSSGPSASTDHRASPTPTEGPTEAVLVGAGDIASCSNLKGSAATAAILDHTAGTIFAAGDNAYPSGSVEQYQACYDPTWGRFKARTKPAVGNHEYLTPHASGYFDYFGAAAGDPSRGYYAFDLNGWRIYVMNSSCSEVGGCQQGSRQEVWLRRDINAHPAFCSMAIWHHPRFSSGLTGSDAEMQDMWADLYAAGAEMLVVGHDHIYERFAPLDAAGRVDRKRGVREFVVGTGGGSHEAIETPVPGSEVRNNNTYGVLKLTLQLDGFRWDFVPEQGKTFTDGGEGVCH